MAQPSKPGNEREYGDYSLFIVVMICLFGGFIWWIATGRLHLTKPEVAEGLVYGALFTLMFTDLFGAWKRLIVSRKSTWPLPGLNISDALERKEMSEAHPDGRILLGHTYDHKPFYWTNQMRSMQTIAAGASGAGKSTLIENILQQDIARGVPVIFIDGKGELAFLQKILPAIEAAGRMKDLRLIDPNNPDKSVSFNPFYAPHGNFDEHVAFVFDSLKREGGDDFFNKHQRIFLESVAKILKYSGRRFNFYDVLVAAFDDKALFRQMQIAVAAANSTDARGKPKTSLSEIRNLEMAVHNLKSTFEDKERVSKIQGLINDLMTFMGENLSTITGPYDNLLTVDDVLDQNLILYISLNVNKNKVASTALGRILLKNLQLSVGERYAKTGFGDKHNFVSVLLDEFAPFAYDDFATIVQQARGSNVGLMFALQAYPQLAVSGKTLQQELSEGPNNKFMLRISDNTTASQYRENSGSVLQDRISMRVEKGGVLADSFQDLGEGSRSQQYDTRITDDNLRRLPNGQMMAITADSQLGMKHYHINFRRPFAHYFMGAGNNLYPAMRTPAFLSEGLNLRFADLNLDEPNPEEQQKARNKKEKRGRRS